MNPLENIIEKLKEQMQHAKKNAIEEIKKIRVDKIDPDILGNVLVMAYGTLTPLSQIANIKNIDTKTVEIKPWEKSLLQEIEKGIIKSNIGLTPQNKGEVILLIAPPLTEERRLQLVKQAKTQIENYKIKIRTIRQNTKDELKNLKEEKISQDVIKTTEAKIQTITDDHVREIDRIFEEKKKDLLQI